MRATAIKALALSVVVAVLAAAGLGMSVRGSDSPRHPDQQDVQGRGADSTPTAEAAQPSSSLTITTQPERQTIAPGHTAQFRVRVRRTGALKGIGSGPRQRPAAPVRLSAIGSLPAGLSASIAPATTRSATSTLRLAAIASTKLGTYRVRLGARTDRAKDHPSRAEAIVTLMVAARSRRFGIRGALVGLLAPGVDRPVALSLTNPDLSPLTVVGLRVGVQRIDAPAADSAHPCTAAVTYPSGVVKARAVPLTLIPGFDTPSGVDADSATIERQQTTLDTTTDTCGTTYGSFATVTLAGGSDTSVDHGRCYRYRYLIADSVGNQRTYTSGSVAKVDTMPKITAIASEQFVGGAGDGRLQVGDRLVIHIDESLATASVPATFAGATESRVASSTVKLTIPGFTNGAVDTGSFSYLSGTAGSALTATFGGSATLVNAGAATTVTLTVTSLSGATTAASVGSMVFAPATTLTGADGIGANLAFKTASTFKLF